MKYIKYIILSILIVLIGFNYKSFDNGVVTNNSIDKNLESIPNTIVIDKIKLNNEYSISSINEYVMGIVMFKETGRPNITGSNTVIGAHSGYGSNAYFNELSNLEINDRIDLIYDNKRYVYIVDEVKLVDETDMSVLNDSDDNILTLLTCKIGNPKKRVVIVSKLSNI